MPGRDRPTVGRLAVYLVLSAAFTGLIAGGANAAGAFEWAAEEIERPVWLLPSGIVMTVWIAKTLMLAFGLWSVERFGRERWRWLGVASILAATAAGVASIFVILILRDLSLGFLSILITWLATIFAAWAVGRASMGAGAFLWLPLAFQSYALVASFEVMRLNTGL